MEAEMKAANLKKPTDGEYIHVELRDGSPDVEFFATKQSNAFDVLGDALDVKGLDFEAIMRQSVNTSNKGAHFSGIVSNTSTGVDYFTFSCGNFELTATGPFPLMNEDAKTKRAKAAALNARLSQ